MKLEIGKSYRRRDGRGPVFVRENKVTPYEFKCDKFHYTKNGRLFTDAIDSCDLVEEWDEPEIGADKPAKPDWYWGFWETNYNLWFELLKADKITINSSPIVDGQDSVVVASSFADAACAERMKREAV
ncbi:MAG: hypothetical protein ACRC2U_07835 [Aeromonas sp.]